MMEYVFAKWPYILSSTVLFGTGVGSAYYAPSWPSST